MFAEAGIDDRRKDGVMFERFIFKKRWSVGGDRLKRRIGRQAQRGKRVDSSGSAKAKHGEQCCMMSTGRK